MTKFSKIDIPVLLIFFARPKQTALVFEQIKLARPSKLYLYQDGARENRLDDIKNIEICREIVSDIDWNCQVKTFFQDENFGCDPSEFIAQKWMFENEEYGIVLEDDDVPSQSFFPFCKEILEKYKFDERINMVCGMNNFGEMENNPDSYFFSTSGSIWGWATWKRVIDQWDDNYKFLDDKFSLLLLKNKLGKRFFNLFYKKSIGNRETKKAHYESILASSLYLNSRLNIIPTKNLISNIGIGENGTHASDSIEDIPKAIRKVLFMKTYEIEFPLKHPKYVIEDVQYKEKINKLLGNGYPLIKFSRRIETQFYRIIHGNFKAIFKAIKRSW